MNRLRRSDWRGASVIRHHLRLGFIRLAIVGMRYFDRGAGGFIGGGAFVYEGRVTCITYPEPMVSKPALPAIDSVAGWGFIGSVPIDDTDGQTLEIADRPATRPMAKRYEKKFWTIDEAIAYANGEDGGEVARDTSRVNVRLVRGEYRVEKGSDGWS